jgi:hypothetical protein
VAIWADLFVSRCEPFRRFGLVSGLAPRIAALMAENPPRTPARARSSGGGVGLDEVLVVRTFFLPTTENAQLETSIRIRRRCGGASFDSADSRFDSFSRSFLDPPNIENTEAKGMPGIGGR